MISKYLVGKFTLKRLIISCLEIYVILGVVVYFFADRLAHHPPTEKYGALPGEISLTTSDGVRLCSVWVPNKKATYTILYSHGNGEDLFQDMFFIRELWGSGFNIFAYDYRGYGRSEGKPSEKGLYRDIDTAYFYLTNNLKIPADHILVLGKSMGSGPSTYLASTKSVGALILESAYTSEFRVAIPFPLFPFDQFPNLERISQVKCPLLVIHGTKDSLIPIRHGKTLFEAYQGKKQYLWVEGANHNDVFPTAPDAYLEAIHHFIHLL